MEAKVTITATPQELDLIRRALQSHEDLQQAIVSRVTPVDAVEVTIVIPAATHAYKQAARSEQLLTTELLRKIS